VPPHFQPDFKVPVYVPPPDLSSFMEEEKNKREDFYSKWIFPLMGAGGIGGAAAAARRKSPKE
jgi:hypothetical protein